MIEPQKVVIIVALLFIICVMPFPIGLLMFKFKSEKLKAEARRKAEAEADGSDVVQDSDDIATANVSNMKTNDINERTPSCCVFARFDLLVKSLLWFLGKV